MTCGRPVFRGSGGPVSSAGMVIREWSVPFRASTVSGRKQRRGEGPAGVRGQWPGSDPLGGARGGAQLQGGSRTPTLGARRRAGAAPRAAVLLRWVVSLQQLPSCWAGKRRLEDGAQGGGPTSARVASERLHQAWWPLSGSLLRRDGRALRSALCFDRLLVPCLARACGLQQPGSTARRRHCVADRCHRLRGPGAGSTERPGDFSPPWAVWGPASPAGPTPPPPAQAHSCVTADPRPAKPRRFIPGKPGTLRDLRKTSTPCLPAARAQEVYLQYI